MISNNSLLNRKINTLVAFLIVFLFFLILAAIIISQAQKLSFLERPLPLLISPSFEEGKGF